MSKISLSVVIPSYNEEKNVAQCLTRVSAVLRRLNAEYEIILVDDGSKDRTGEIAKSFLSKIPHLSVVENHPNLGYGGALRAGFAQATKEFIAFVPADNQFDFSEISKLLAAQKKTGADIVSGIRSNRRDPFHRRLAAWGWNTSVRALFGYLASDIDCGFKLFKREILEQVNLTAKRGAMIDTQLLAGARARGFTVAEIPLTHLPRTSGVGTGVHPRVIIQSFLDLFVFWWRLKQEILVERGKSVFRWEMFLLLAVLILAGFVRLYRLPDYMTFLGDEGRDAAAVRDIVLGRHLPLIGPGTSVGNMYLGPLYYYLIAPSLWLADFSPVGPAVEVALFGVLTVGLLWWLARQWFARGIALALSLLYALSPLVIIYSRSSWNPNIMPFFSLLTIYALWKVVKWGYWRWAVIGAVSFSFVLNSHYLGLLLLPTIAAFLLFRARQDLPSHTSRMRPNLLAAIGLFLILQSPLLLFDLRHDLANARNITQFFAARQTTVNLKIYKSLPHVWPIWQDISTSLLASGEKSLGSAAAWIVPGLALFAFFRRRLPRLEFILTAAWLLVGIVGLGLYKQHIYAHYYGFLFPAPFLLLGFAASSLSSIRFSRWGLILVGIVLLALALKLGPFRSSANYQLARTQAVADAVINHSGGRPFNLALISNHNYDASYRYLLSQRSAPYFTIHDRITDQLFVICETPPCDPINHPLWEIASFGWAKIEAEWDFDWGVKLFRLGKNPSGAPPPQTESPE